ncbi:class I SAM-dependent methyltransferase [Pseudomonas petrae]|uniref:Class I SAM-dependent methyltransferase n=1 Tax=Pseudomonas petrae TaxID=2912190 RepID=A0ABS9I6Y8_9PSED|nr:class I SAM-dependent methyltransferase [Pseudomonas petrae]MCF7530730.1 class I SAM-dependent methyltransferase [Pseudomonas petrae]MCF7536402.1 class I SAM-dependent methyltransferase [Pseudomonas petrae]MCF7542944.1 class I SAM-dependent methyltransferase [Pseudomonas petrae]MCF7554081.1 class I SAM-dependent methyltransferase [Pseudomonas petrae]
MPPVIALSPADRLAIADHDYAGQYAADFVERWDELIDWDKRAAGEGSFFYDLLRQAGAWRVLDVATGSGFHAAQLHNAGFDVTACDGSPTMVDRARRNFDRLGVGVPVHRYDWQALDPRVLGKFDAVLCLGSSLCHLFDREARIAVLKRFRQMLKPGGILLVDQRNFEAILAGRFTSSGRYYYCGDTASVTLGELDESICEFVYRFADGAQYRLRVCPIRPRQLQDELRAAGFRAPHAYGDFKPVYDVMNVDFIIHQAHA